MRRIEQAFGLLSGGVEGRHRHGRDSSPAELEKAVEGVLSSAQVDDGWIYVPRQETRDFMSGQVRERPFSARVFGLPRRTRSRLARRQARTMSHFTSGRSRSSSACG